MAALAANRNTQARTMGLLGVFKVAAATHIWGGSLVAVNATGFLIPVADAAGMLIIGRADEEVNNTGADGALSCRVQQGVFKWAKTAAVNQALVGRTVTGSDDQTVAAASDTTNDNIAGVLIELDADGGAWVATFSGKIV